MIQDWHPTDPVVARLRFEVLTACGVDDPYDHSFYEPEVVAEHLGRWFRRVVPDMLVAADYDAIERQGVFLTHYEGGGMYSWDGAVQKAFPEFPYQGHDHRWRIEDVPEVLLRGMHLYSEAFGRLANSLGIKSIRVWRRLRADRAAQQIEHRVKPVSSVSWNRAHMIRHDEDDPAYVLMVADVDPRVVVGVTVGRECHPVVTPFQIGRGPGHADVRWVVETA
ncbi:Hypothetical protein ERS075564_00003 [Mycobacteroides abscessus]|uniref:Uncharacterized protein n=7 Tax=Mycobacteroides abscessus TaxID=36809 RepID=B1MGL2_MYCA9|nr:hypothetical protein [Mycobacteroides abscessus]EUA64236.1 hypothetical protein I542_4404 [Mycobacteroides abscessus 1948]AIC72981.1 hypothetical protein MYCMA_13020 [Mycobacteroides abscessus subsp. massiliense str. GO 06]ALM15234.1 hypothetical protein AOY11_02070 [Mycobacteroides abscessus]AMU24504.1 hypothetical protein A3N96_02935 [Mycobacteroides abscessus]AMU34233.1 hypothetical protein A3N98_02400 [Mycobacteroides abscessus]